jgi:uncharacterized membrane protein
MDILAPGLASLAEPSLTDAQENAAMNNPALRTLAIAGLVTLSLTLAGCGGGDTTVKAETTTTGQELMDLKKAYEAGAISEREYEKQREKILDN